MAAIARSVATLRIFGESLDPEEITPKLAANPTDSYRKDVVVRTPSGSEFTRKQGMWRIKATPREPEDLNAQVTELLSSLTSDLRVWQTLDDDFRVDLFCGLFMKASNEGFNL